MPTIDQLAPATAASDDDELLVSQAGITRKVTRAQVLSGVQPQLALANGNLLGRCTSGTGAAETIAIGANLVLNNGTLSADAASFVVASQQKGTVPVSGDLVAIGQSGSNKAVSYGQLMSGLPGVANVDGSQLLLTPSGAQAAVKLADYASSTVPLSGGTMTGPLSLASDPVAGTQAATKTYVDVQVAKALPQSGGTVSGTLTLSADPTAALQAATKRYVDIQVGTSVPTTGGTLSGGLTLARDPTGTLEAATKQYVDARVSRSGDTLTGPLTLAGDPTAALQAATRQYVDGQVSTALPKAGGTVSGGLYLGSDPTSALQAASKRYVDAQTATALPLSGGTLTGPLTLAGVPTSTLQAATKQYVDSQAAQGLPLSGGALTGPLTLAANPTTDMQAATKQYADSRPDATGVINVKLPPYGAKLNGTTDDTAAFKAAYLAAAPGSVIYVPNGVCNLQNPNNWGIPLGKWVKWIVDGTTLPNGASLAVAVPNGTGPASLNLPGVVVGNSGLSLEASQGSSQASDFAILHTSYIVNHNGGSTGSVSAASRNDIIIYNSPNNYIWGGVDRLIWSGTQTPNAATPAQHVARYMQAIRATIGTDASGKPLPQPQVWAACLEYRDTTGKQSSSTSNSITVEMDWFGNGADDGNNRQIQSLVVGQNDRNGSPVEVSGVIGVYLAGGHSGHVFKVFNVCIPFSTAVLDTTGSQQLPGAAAIRLAAGHAIAFEPTNSYKLWYDSSSATLKWNQGDFTFPVGKGITVGFQGVYGSSATIPNYLAGNIIFLVGGGTYTITLPSASTVPIGTGYTFSALGPGVVNIVASGADAIDNGPIALRQNDRYHVISDGNACWREIFRTNAMGPKYGAPPILPAYSVAGLPGAPGAGAQAFATNGRKPSEGAGAGSGVVVFHDGARWISVCSGAQVQT